MKYLLDTHIILWALIDDERLNPYIKDIIMDPNHSIYYSTVSPWEVEIKHLKDNKFKLTGEQLCFLCDQNGLTNLPIRNDHVIELDQLLKDEKVKHGDPFDRILLAQAITEKMILITSDQKFKSYHTKNLMVV